MVVYRTYPLIIEPEDIVTETFAVYAVDTDTEAAVNNDVNMSWWVYVFKGFCQKK